MDFINKDKLINVTSTACCEMSVDDPSTIELIKHSNDSKIPKQNLTELNFFLEGHRSRSYGRTAALRLIVQHYDEDEEKDDQFLFHFSK
jgi:hypothetical protein